jgi:hypothetical protein
MTVVTPHHSTEQATISVLDKAADQLLAGGGNKNVEIVEQKKSWDGPVMSFSFTGKVGFISVPMAGTVAVDETNVTVECELPSLVKNFMGEAKIQAMVEEKIRALVQPAA